MKTNVTLNGFRDAFQTCRPDNFSYEGLDALYDWLIELEDDTGEEIELDVIALCCDFNEYENLAEFQKDYNAEDYTNIEDIENKTIVIHVGRVSDEGFIIECF